MWQPRVIVFACLLIIKAAANSVAAPPDPPGFGRRIAVSGDDLLVSAPFAAGKGKVFLFRRTGEKHRLVQTIKPPFSLGRGEFGQALELRGGTLVVGDSQATSAFTSSAGAAFVYEIEGETLSEPVRLISPKPQRNAVFGDALALRDDWLAIGESGNSDGGGVTLFRRHDGVWKAMHKLSATQLDTDDRSISMFGQSVALTSKELIVGAPMTRIGDKRFGLVFVYQRDDEGKLAKEPTQLVWPDQPPDAFFGHDLAVGDDFVVVSALLAEINGIEGAGAACVYVRGKDGQLPDHPTAVLTPNKPLASEGFSSSLAIVDRRIFVGTGAPHEGERSVYVFEPKADAPTQWGQVARLQAKAKGASFGSWGIAAAGDRLYVGDPFPGEASPKLGQIVIFARETSDGQTSYREVETIAMPE